MNLLGCLDTPSEGAYILEGSDVSTLSDHQLSAIRNRQIGFIFQGFNLIPSLTALELSLIHICSAGYTAASNAATAT